MLIRDFVANKMKDCEVGGGIRFSKKVMVRSNPRSKPPQTRAARPGRSEAKGEAKVF
jgi:hypothetical protein